MINTKRTIGMRNKKMLYQIKQFFSALTKALANSVTTF